MMIINKTMSAAIAGLVIAAASSQATVLLPGQFGPLGIDSGAGLVVADLLNQAVVQTQPVPPYSTDGTISSWVVAGDPSNPLGGLTFVYQFRNLAASAVESIALTGFGGLTAVDVEAIAGSPTYVGGAIGTADPAIATFGGGTVTFELFGAGIAQNAYTYYMIVNTAATSYGLATGLAQDSFQAAGTILAPTAVPEVTTAIAGALLLLPFGASTIRILRRNRAA